MATHKTPATTRREFIRLMGGALGGVTLGMYGGGAHGQGGGPGGPALPNGYNFYRVFTVGGTNPFDFPALSGIIPGIMLTERSQILFHGLNASGNRGVYALDVFYPASGPPQITGADKVVEVGDTLPANKAGDTRTVHHIDVGDTNALGSYATVIGTDNPGTVFPAGPATPNPGLPENNWVPLSTAPQPTAPPVTASGVYLMTDPGSGLQPLASLTDPTPPLQNGETGEFGGIFGDIALQDDNSVLLNAFFTLGTQYGQSLFDLEGGVASHIGRTVLTTGEMLPQSGAILTAIGLIDVSSDGYYVAQAYGAHRGRGGGWGRGVRRDALQPSALISGHVRQNQSQARLLAASRELRPGNGNAVIGETILGPRVGPGNVVGHVAHVTDTIGVLAHHRGNRRTVLSQTGATVLGDEIGPQSPPVIGPTGLMYYSQEMKADDGFGYSQLYVSNGGTDQLLLQSMDPVAPTGLVTDIHFGYHPGQADSAGRIVFMAEFLSSANADPMNPANITTSIVVGIPV